MLAVCWTTVVQIVSQPAVSWIFGDNICCTVCDGCLIVAVVVERNCNPNVLALLTTKAYRSTTSLRSQSISGLHRIGNVGSNHGVLDIVVSHSTRIQNNFASLSQQPGDVTRMETPQRSCKGYSGACKSPQRP